MKIKPSTFLDWATAAAVACVASACVGDPAPEPGPTRTLAETGASNPTVAIDSAAGAIYVAWVGTNAGASNVFFTRSADGGMSYSEVARVNHLPGNATPHEQAPAQVAVGPDGTVYVVWQRARPADWLPFGGADLYLARSNDGGRTWEPAITVNSDADGAPARHSFHDIAVGPNGTVYVSWIDARERDTFRRRLALSEERSAGDRRAGPASGGDPRAAGEEAEEPGTDIRVARSLDGGRSFQPGVVIDTMTCPCCRSSIAVGDSGTVYVAWRKVYPGSIRDIVVARSTDRARSFSAPVRVHRDGWEFPGCPHAGPSVAVDTAGRVHVGWYTGREGNPGLYYTVSRDNGGSFGDVVPLLAADWVPPSQVKIDAGRGGIWIAWDDRRVTGKRIRLARADGRGSIESIGDDPIPGASPAVAAAAGIRAVAWLDGESVRIRVIPG